MKSADCLDYCCGIHFFFLQIWKYNPRTDICLIYTIAAGQSKSYAAGKVPENIKKLERIADHYAIPSVHTGLQASILEKQGRLIWKFQTKPRQTILNV